MYEVRENKNSARGVDADTRFTEQNGTNAQIPRARVRGKKGT